MAEVKVKGDMVPAIVDATYGFSNENQIQVMSDVEEHGYAVVACGEASFRVRIHDWATNWSFEHVGFICKETHRVLVSRTYCFECKEWKWESQTMHISDGDRDWEVRCRKCREIIWHQDAHDYDKDEFKRKTWPGNNAIIIARNRDIFGERDTPFWHRFKIKQRTMDEAMRKQDKIRAKRIEEQVDDSQDVSEVASESKSVVPTASTTHVAVVETKAAAAPTTPTVKEDVDTKPASCVMAEVKAEVKAEVGAEVDILPAIVKLGWGFPAPKKEQVLSDIKEHGYSVVECTDASRRSEIHDWAAESKLEHVGFICKEAWETIECRTYCFECKAWKWDSETKFVEDTHIDHWVRCLQCDKIIWHQDAQDYPKDEFKRKSWPANNAIAIVRDRSILDARDTPFWNRFKIRKQVVNKAMEKQAKRRRKKEHDDSLKIRMAAMAAATTTPAVTAVV